MFCRECVWWDVDPALMTDGVRVGRCTHQMVVQPTHGEYNRRMREDGVLTCDEGGYTGELMTGPDFGCIHAYAVRAKGAQS